MASDAMALVRVEPGRVFRFVAVNQPYLRMIRGHRVDVSVRDIVDHTLVEVATCCNLSAADVEEIRKRYERVIDGGVAFEQEVVFPAPGGRRRGHVRLAPVLDGEGCCQYIVCSTSESMDRLRALMMLDQSEEKFARAFRSTPAPMSISRLSDGRFIDVNDACCKLWGYARDEFIGHTASQMNLWHDPADRQRFFEKFHASGSVRDLEIIIRTRQDAHRIVLFSAERVEVAGEPCMVASIHDVTATREAERVQRQVETQLRQAQKLEALGTLAGGIAHDFNNILTVIVAVTELVGMDCESPNRIRGHVAELTAASDRARALVGQILTFSRHRDQERNAVDLRDIVVDAFHLLLRGLPPNLSIETRVDDHPVVVRADANQLHQVLMNLGTNAAHAMRSRTGPLTVTVDKLQIEEPRTLTVSRLEPGWYARIVVEDEGEGMDEKTIAHAFEPFYTTKMPGEGTGLGLAVVHGIVREHNGGLDIVSSRGEGTRVSVYLPLHEGTTDARTTPERAAATEGQGQHVLFVDDERAVGMVCASLLTRNGYKVTVFQSPVDALARFSQRPEEFDLVVTDLSMPFMTGDQLVRALLALRPTIPVLMITGFSAGLTRHKVREMGVVDLLQKPIAGQTLMEAVRRALSAASA